jgi:hypothetical protein
MKNRRADRARRLHCVVGDARPMGDETGALYPYLKISVKVRRPADSSPKQVQVVNHCRAPLGPQRGIQPRHYEGVATAHR